MNSATVYHKFRNVCIWSTSYSCHILINLNFLDRLSKNSQESSFMKNVSSWSRVAPCWQKDGRTDVTKLPVVFRNFANAHKNHENIRLYKLLLSEKQLDTSRNRSKCDRGHNSLSSRIIGILILKVCTVIEAEFTTFIRWGKCCWLCS
jgi:hypothetical protein